MDFLQYRLYYESYNVIIYNICILLYIYIVKLSNRLLFCVYTLKNSLIIQEENTKEMNV
jgi:hypothetical protein